MPTVADALAALESLAPARIAYSWDRIGLQVGAREANVSKAVVSLDRSLAAVRFAAEIGAELLVAHHPLVWEPLERIDPATHVGRTVTELIRSGIAFAAAHTNWDAAPGGINDALAGRLGLVECVPFGSGASIGDVKLVFFCPAASTDAVVDALAAEGAGTIGLYRRCAFLSPGVGTFESLPEAQPTVGSPGQRERVDETRVEMRVPQTRMEAVRAALARAHPYEEPAADWYGLEPAQACPIGRIGQLSPAARLEAFGRQVDERLGTRSTVWGDPSQQVTRVAVVGGGADDEWRAANAAGADVLVTGEVRQHTAVEAVEQGFALIAAGHYATENPGCAALRERLAAALPEIEWHHFEPEPGQSGRPM